MNDLDMHEAFDFKALSLDEPEDRLQKQFDQTLNLSSITDQEGSAIPHAAAVTQASLLRSATTLGHDDDTVPVIVATKPSDNGAWAKLPSPSEVNPFQPGVTAQKLDAMAMDRNHVFKSAQTPDPFPFTAIPQPPLSTSSSMGSVPESSTTASASSASTFIKGKDKMTEVDTGAGSGSGSAPVEKNDIKKDQKQNDEIPNWMLADPELPQHPQEHANSWNMILQDASQGPAFTSQDFTLGWGSTSDDLSTTVDSNALFGFSSYPTYESLPISHTIAEEMNRQALGLENSSRTSSSYGGFAKYGAAAGESVFGNPTSAPWSTPGSGSISTPAATTATQQWQDWRSVPQLGQDLDLDFDLDLDLDLDDFEGGKSNIKATPGFAPAQFRHV